MSPEAGEDGGGGGVRRARKGDVTSGRRRRVTGGRQHGHLVRVTPEEEAELVQRAEAHGVSVPRLLVEAALADEAGQTSTERREALAELFGLYRLLGRIANNVNQVAKATHANDGVAPENAGAVFDRVWATLRRVDDAIERV